MQFDTRIAVVLRNDLAVWRKLNVTAFTVSGIAASVPGVTGEAYLRELEAWANEAGTPPLAGILLHQVIIGWTRLHGIISLELDGHFAVGLPDLERVFAAEVDDLVQELHAALTSLR